MDDGSAASVDSTGSQVKNHLIPPTLSSSAELTANEIGGSGDVVARDHPSPHQSMQEAMQSIQPMQREQQQQQGVEQQQQQKKSHNQKRLTNDFPPPPRSDHSETGLVSGQPRLRSRRLWTRPTAETEIAVVDRVYPEGGSVDDEDYDGSDGESLTYAKVSSSPRSLVAESVDSTSANEGPPLPQASYTGAEGSPKATSSPLMSAAGLRSVSGAAAPLGLAAQTTSPRMLHSSRGSLRQQRSHSSDNPTEWASLWNQRRSKRLRDRSTEMKQKKRVRIQEEELLVGEPESIDKEEAESEVEVEIDGGEDQQAGGVVATASSIGRLVGDGCGAFEPRFPGERVAGSQTTSTRRLVEQQQTSAAAAPSLKASSTQHQQQQQQLLPPPGTPAEKTKNKNEIKSATLAAGGSNAPTPTSSNNNNNNIGTKSSKSDASVRYNPRPKRSNAGKHTEIWRNKWMTH